MKRLFALVLVITLAFSISPACFAEVDLSGLSYDELVALKDQINLAIWNSAEWKEVEVPQGVWEVGADIPAGKWTIHVLPSNVLFVQVGDRLTNGGADVSNKAFQSMKGEYYSGYNPQSDVTSWTIELSAGEYVKISYSSAIFTPYAGKPDLGFK